jgi:predicted dehydrogenase
VKALVVGGGSIGTRHLRNLRALGVAETAVVDADPQRLAVLCRDEDARGFGSLDEGLAWGPDVTVIATPSQLHVEQARAAAWAGSHLFIEKPLSHTSEGLDALTAEVRERGLISLVGCNMRFHPGPAQVKRLLEAGAIGKVLFARVFMGSYLPGWRPWQDYRQSYSANAAMGGGCILDIIHEIDLARWYLGPVREVFCAAEHVSSLEMDVEDLALLICRHAAGCVSNVQLDYFERTYERGCQIAGEHGTLFWSFTEGVVKAYDARTEGWTSYPQPEGWETNRMYVDELSHFLGCVREGSATMFPVDEAIEVMRVALAAKESARTGAFVVTEGVF